MLARINTRFVIIIICFIMTFLLWIDVWGKLNDLTLVVYETKNAVERRKLTMYPWASTTSSDNTAE